MKKQINNKLALTASLMLLVGNQVQAADGTSSNITNPPRYVPHSSTYPTPPPGGWEGMIDAIDKQTEQQKQDEARGYMGQSNPWAAGRGAPEPGYGQQQRPRQDSPWQQQAPQQQQWGQQQRPQQQQWGQQRSQQLDPWGQQHQHEPPPQYDRGQRDWGYGTPYSSGPSLGGSGPGFGSPSFNTGRGPGFGTSRGPGYKGPKNRKRGRDYPWGGKDMPWDSKSMPWSSKKGRGGSWFDKDKMADAWDDMINAPSDMGEMPGGWSAPSVSMPNPVDVGDEFDRAARDLPDQMHNIYEDNRRYNSRSYRR